MSRIILALALCLGLAACGESRLNPLNWFGGEREERIRVTEVETVTDPRPLVAEITALSIEPTTSGAILTATALTDATGYWQAELVEGGRAEGEAVFEFRAAAPLAGAMVGPAPTREIRAAVALNQDDLEGLRSVTVIGRENRRTVTRR
jgi:hypothetical protein